jgi:putative molybdopterin biosynthesis protein
LLHKGAHIGSREIGMLAACWLASVEVVRCPRVGVLSTGDELVEPGRPLKPAGVYDSNGAIIAAAIREAGGEPVAFGAFPDDEAALERAMRTALDCCDIVVLSGGTSKGRGPIAPHCRAARSSRNSGPRRGAETRQAALPRANRR